MVVEKKDYINDFVEESESKVDVSGNCASIPEFGSYKEILIEERIDLLM